MNFKDISNAMEEGFFAEEKIEEMLVWPSFCIHTAVF